MARKRARERAMYTAGTPLDSPFRHASPDGIRPMCPYTPACDDSAPNPRSATLDCPTSPNYVIPSPPDCSETETTMPLHDMLPTLPQPVHTLAKPTS